MIGLAFPAVGDEAVAFDLGALAGRAVDDRGAAARAGDAEGFVEGVVDQAAAVGGFLDLGDPQRQVRAREAAHDLGRLGREAEARDDLVPDVGGRGRGAGEDAGLGVRGEDAADLEVLGAEVVAPLADAVGLVDREEGTVESAQDLPEAREDEALGRDI